VTLHWDSVVEGVTAGIAASVLLGIFALSRDTIRNVVLRLRLMRAFRFLSCGSRLEGITLGIRNHIGRTFTIRQIVMITDKSDYRFNPTGEVATSFKKQHPRPSRKQLRLLKRGKIKSIPMGTEIQFRSWRSAPTLEGFVVAQPYTSHTFLLPAQLIADFDAVITGFCITLDYESWTHAIKIMQVRTSGSLDQVRKTVEQFKKQIKDGSLDSARAKFRQPPIQGGASDAT
jgi:hypothetical protein